MSLPNRSPDQFIAMYMSTALNKTRLEEDPPSVEDVDDPSHRANLLLSRQGSARYWDIYQDILQVSFLYANTFCHYMLCEAGVNTDKIVVRENSIIYLYDNEEDLVRAVFQQIVQLMGPVIGDGVPMYGRMLVGWNMHSEVWPMLVNRAIKYRIPVYRDMLADPDAKWHTTRHIGDISAIYTQGSHGSRRTPGLVDLLKYWGFGDSLRPKPEALAEMICSQPMEVAKYVESYLTDIYCAMRLYHELDTVQEVLNPVSEFAPVPGVPE